MGLCVIRTCMPGVDLMVTINDFILLMTFSR